MFSQRFPKVIYLQEMPATTSNVWQNSEHSSPDVNTTRMKDYESSALAETMMYIQERLSVHTEIAGSIKLSDIRKFYENGLSKLAGEEINVNVTCLKEKILDLDTDQQAVQDKKEIYISFKTT